METFEKSKHYGNNGQIACVKWAGIRQGESMQWKGQGRKNYVLGIDAKWAALLGTKESANKVSNNSSRGSEAANGVTKTRAGRGDGLVEVVRGAGTSESSHEVSNNSSGSGDTSNGSAKVLGCASDGVVKVRKIASLRREVRTRGSEVSLKLFGGARARVHTLVGPSKFPTRPPTTPPEVARPPTVSPRPEPAEVTVLSRLSVVPDPVKSPTRVPTTPPEAGRPPTVVPTFLVAPVTVLSRFVRSPR
jgi:hypothetical protein